MHKNRGGRYEGKLHLTAEHRLLCVFTLVESPQKITYRREQMKCLYQ